jgi:beta-lactamase regulating signal transducer with metallopeptidase domain
MASLMWWLVVEGALLIALVILLIYRSTLSMHEDDQLFLTESESHMQKEQVEIMHKLNQVTPMVKLVGAASGVLGLVIVGVFVYQQLQMVQ